MLRGRTPPPPVRQSRKEAARDASPRRSSWLIQGQMETERRHSPGASFSRRLRLDSDEADQLIDGRRSGGYGEDEHDDWRQNAQMLTERDEMLLLAGEDALDVAPVNRRLQQANLRRRIQTPTSTTETSSRHSPVVGAEPNQRRTIFTLSKLQETGKKQTSGKSKSKKSKLHERSLLRHNDDEDNEDVENEPDDNSSISFAQSGCHSILSAWRIKAANKAARLAASSRASKDQQRPRSVLSNSSSVGKKSAASTAFTQGSRGLGLAAAKNRIPIGPKAAQHFVTNSRRRRRANELIMNTLEARRRAISLNRQNVLGSLFGSESYLGDISPALGQQHQFPQDDYQRLSMSPSPANQLLLRSPSPYGNDSTAAVELTRRSALSDLGGRQSPATAAQRSKLLMLSRARRQNSSPLLAATAGSNTKLAPTRASHRSRLSQLSGSSGTRPPLAKLDQNSSDLCSSNDSSSGGEFQAESSSSSCSQFTQLVTSELTPSQILLGEDDDANRRSFHERLSDQKRREYLTTAKQTPAQLAAIPPKPASRTKRKQQKAPASPMRSQPPLASRSRALTKTTPSKSSSNQVKTSTPQQVSTTSEEDDKTGKLRRGALKRDSIRRLRLTRQQEAEQGADASSSSNEFNQQRTEGGSNPIGRTEEDDQSGARAPPRPLSKARKLDIESNPFLNRHHFRSLSSRSIESRQSVNSQPLARYKTSVSPSHQASRLMAEEVRRSPRLIEDNSGRHSARHSTPATSVARRAQRSTPITVRNDDDEPVLDMPQIDMDNVRQVERILREFQPVQKAARGLREASSERRHASSREPQKSIKNESDENVFKTTTRLVREGARASDNLKCDLAGNRRQVELSERWRHERLPPVLRDDGSTFSEEKFLNERLEVRKSQELIRSISPPAEFSDRFSSDEHRHDTRATFAPVQPPKPSNRFGEFSAGERAGLSLARSLPPPPPQLAPPMKTNDGSSRLRSERLRADSSPVRSKPAVLPRSKSTSRASTSRTAESVVGPSKSLKEATFVRASPKQSSLPKFERTADDEFRKRVDQLRQMAKAHLEASEAQQARETRRRDQTRLVKPMSTNWEGPAANQNKANEFDSVDLSRGLNTAAACEPSFSANDATVQRNSAHTANRKQPVTSKLVASTNLDDMLLADRYQKPLESGLSGPRTGTWRRSNSSLASVGLSRTPNATGSQLNARSTRPMSPQAGQIGSSGSILSTSAMSVGPRESDLATPMRLIVRERRAPQMDFAQLEQRPPTQHAETIAENVSGVSGRPQAEPAYKTWTVAPSLKASTETTANPLATRSNPVSLPASSSSLTGSRLQRVSSPKLGSDRMAGSTIASRSSPRSPEFGRAAASSNDDSAIASSISSPSSMNFVVIPAAKPGAPGQLSSSSQRPAHLMGTNTRAPVRSIHSDSSWAVPGSAPSIQSILRRQQIARGASLASGDAAAGHSQATSGGSTSNQFGANQTLPMRTQSDEMNRFQSGDAADNHEARRPLSPSNSQLQQQAQSTKRVHFNDRTSVRSFESISSTNSNNTAIPQQHQQSDLDDFSARQQVGSPDSMGSGSTSRLSCESPAFGDFRRIGGPNDSSSGAAIYAIRGDPELDLATGSGNSTIQVPPGEGPLLGQAMNDPMGQFYVASPHHQRQSSMAGIHYQPQGQPFLHMSAAPAIRQQPVAPVSSAIRMTAPPAINTNAHQYQHHVQQQRQQLLSPLAADRLQQGHSQAGMVAQQTSRVPNPSRPSLVSDNLDGDDPDYALRLRLAATRRVFNFAQPGQQQQQTQAGYSTPPQTSGGGNNGGQTATRRNPSDLANFQTEV